MQKGLTQLKNTSLLIIFLGRNTHLPTQNYAADIPNKYGLTGLHVSAHGGHVECMKLLLAYKCDINGFDSRGDTPLELAIRRWEWEWVYKCMLPVLANHSEVCGHKISSEMVGRQMFVSFTADLSTAAKLSDTSLTQIMIFTLHPAVTTL